jgi:hypothetical protein
MASVTMLPLNGIVVTGFAANEGRKAYFHTCQYYLAAEKDEFVSIILRYYVYTHKYT